MISFREHVKGTTIEADWIDALIVGLDFLKTESADRKLAALKIVLFSELGCRFKIETFIILISLTSELSISLWF